MISHFEQEASLDMERNLENELFGHLCYYALQVQELFRFKGMLRRNIEHFLKKCTSEKSRISEMKYLMKFFFLFSVVCIFYFC